MDFATHLNHAVRTAVDNFTRRSSCWLLSFATFCTGLYILGHPAVLNNIGMIHMTRIFDGNYWGIMFLTVGIMRITALIVDFEGKSEKVSYLRATLCGISAVLWIQLAMSMEPAISLSAVFAPLFVIFDILNTAFSASEHRV